MVTSNSRKKLKLILGSVIGVIIFFSIFIYFGRNDKEENLLFQNLFGAMSGAKSVLYVVKNTTSDDIQNYVKNISLFMKKEFDCYSVDLDTFRHSIGDTENLNAGISGKFADISPKVTVLLFHYPFVVIDGELELHCLLLSDRNTGVVSNCIFYVKVLMHEVKNNWMKYNDKFSIIGKGDAEARMSDWILLRDFDEKGGPDIEQILKIAFGNAESNILSMEVDSNRLRFLAD